MLVKIETAIAVNPDHVVSVTNSFHGSHVLVKMVDGQLHEVQCDYGKSIWDTHARIVAALSQPAPAQEDGDAKSD